MKYIRTTLEGCQILEPRVFPDNRGEFYEGFNTEKFEQETGVSFKFDQLNCSISKKGVLRGLHFQKPPFAQAKIVFVPKGEVLDIAVDLRASSATFGKYVAVKLSSENKRRLVIPKGFGHGFLALSDDVHLNYLVDGPYNPNYDSGIIYNDPDLDIDWTMPDEELIISEKDQKLQLLRDCKNIFQ